MTVTNNYKIIKSIAIGAYSNASERFSRSIIKPANITALTFKDDLKSFGGLSYRQATALINTSVTADELYSTQNRYDIPYGPDNYAYPLNSTDLTNIYLGDSGGISSIGNYGIISYFNPYYDDTKPSNGWYSYNDKANNRDWNYYKDVPAWTDYNSLNYVGDNMISLVVGKGDTTPESPTNYKLDDMVTRSECVQSGGRQAGSIYYKNVTNISNANLVIKEIGLACCFFNYLVPSQSSTSVYDAYAQKVGYFFDTVNGSTQGTTQISYKTDYDAFGTPMLLARVVLETPIVILPGTTKTIYYQFFEE